MLYHYQTKRINETVSRNKERFPENFCFQLTEEEYKLLEHDKKFDKVFDQLQNEENIKQKIFFEGKIYDAYSIEDLEIIQKIINL